jgi:hypothetical protein
MEQHRITLRSALKDLLIIRHRLARTLLSGNKKKASGRSPMVPLLQPPPHHRIEAPLPSQR